ncbi:MAG: phosphatidate cytidylyltransferase [Parasphingopyxis sp.]
MTDIAPPPKFRNLWQRTATAAVLIGIALAALFAGKSALWLLTAALAMIMIGEWSKLMGVGRWQSAVAIALMAALLVFIHPTFWPIDVMTIAVLGGIALVASLAAMSFRLGMGILYIGIATIAILFLREENGIALTLWTLAVVWGTDICAYFAGKLIGGPKLAPSYSPNKTWAGLVGGVGGAMLIGSIIALYAGLPRWLILLAGLFAIIAQLGDLYESWLKRRAGVKDASGIFPGHGGALDRLDGLMPVAIVMAVISAAGLL